MSHMARDVYAILEHSDSDIPLPKLSTVHTERGQVTFNGVVSGEGHVHKCRQQSSLT